MSPLPSHVCWSSVWDGASGFEHVLLARDHADSCLLVSPSDGHPFRLAYRLAWDPPTRRLEHATLTVREGGNDRSLSLRTDGHGTWLRDGVHLPKLDGCLDIDIWPTPLTNSFPLWRSRLHIGERREFLMAWVSAPTLEVQAKPQAYTRNGDGTYDFESLDGSGFRARLTVDAAGLVVDYPGLFTRVRSGAVTGG